MSTKSSGSKSQILRLQRRYGCLLANNNKLAKEIYNFLSRHHADSLAGLSDRSASFDRTLCPAAKPNIQTIVRMLATGQHKRSAQVRSFLKGFDWSPFKPIPNVRDMKLDKGEMDKVYEHFSIDKRTETQIQFSPYRSKPQLRYAAMMIARLRQQEDTWRYWWFAWFLMRRSTVFA